MTLELRDELQDIVRKNRAAAAQLEQNEPRVEALERKLGKLAKERLGQDVKFYVWLRGGSASSTWAPNIQVTGFGEDVGKWWDGRRYIKTVEGWAELKTHVQPGQMVYRHQLVEQRTGLSPEVQVRTAKLEADCAQLAALAGIPVTILVHDFVTAENRGAPRTTDDLLVRHNEGVIVRTGETRYIGWDIPDYWAIIEVEGERHVYYSTNGHGMGYDVHLEPGEDLTSFLAFLADGNTAPPAIEEVKALLQANSARVRR